MNAVDKYFGGEKVQCSIGIAIALVSLALAMVFIFRLKTPLATGMAYPLVVIPVLLLVICASVIVRAPKDSERVNALIKTEVTKIGTEEIPRMEKVMKSFKVLKIVEASLFVAGILAFFLRTSKPLLQGVGLGISLQAAMMFLFDTIADARGEVYLAYLRSLLFAP